MTTKRGFTLIEMLVVIGIIGILLAVCTGAFTKMTSAAERARCQELVSNVATAMTAYFNAKGAWPKSILANNGAKDGELDDKAVLPLVRGGYLALSWNNDKTNPKLTGLDKLGVVTPWASAVIKRRGEKASLSDNVPGGGTVRDHLLHYAVDTDGDGIIEGATIGGEAKDVRATAIVWCCGKDGKIEAYSKGLKRDDVYSFAHGQTQNVK